MATGFEQLSVKQIRSALINLSGMDEEEANKIKGKGDLVYEAISRGIDPKDLETIADANEDLADLVIEDDFEEDDTSPEWESGDTQDYAERAVVSTTPKYCSAEWSDYVLSQLTDTEKDSGGHPRLHGLRRLAEELLGEVIFSGAILLEASLPSDPSMPSRANCNYEVRISWKRDVENWVDLENYTYPVRTFRGVGSSYAGNTDNMFAAFAEAMAENRAEARALRKALGLEGVTSEELTEKNTELEVSSALVREEESNRIEVDWEGDDRLSAQQKSFITTKCKTLGVDLDKFINKKFYLGEVTEKTYDSLDKVSKQIASAMIKELNRYQTDAGDESRAIPSQILLINGDNE